MAHRITQIQLQLSAGRVGGESEWDIPFTGALRHWAVPLAVIEDGEYRSVGTAFHFSRLGNLVTARHCIDEALSPSDRGRDLARHGGRVRPASTLIVKRATEDEPANAVGLSVLTITSPEPTDLVFLTTLFQEKIPQATLPLSFAFPAGGSTVQCFGFPDHLDETIPDYLHAVEGSVKAYFPSGFAKGFVKGPCFLVSGAVPHGMSGGPVVNEGGAICGVVSAGAEMFTNQPSYLVSPLYPGILTEVALHAEPATNVRLNSGRTLLDLCADGYVQTDGTEDRVHFRTIGDEIEIGPIISTLNQDYVFNSLDDYLAGRQSSPLTEGRMRIRIHPNVDQ